MKLVSYKVKGKSNSFRIGCMVEQKIIDVQDSYRLFLRSKKEKEMIESIESILPSDPTAFFMIGEAAIKRAKDAYTFIVEGSDKKSVMIERDDVSLGTPIPSPAKIICIGRNYADHAAEMKSDIPEYPVMFAKYSNALIGPEEDIRKSPLTSKLDYEVELGIVIGKDASRVSKEDAYDYIAGYTIGNDITARDLQKRTVQWLQGKTLDRTTPIGPWIITSDEIGDPTNLAIRSYVNGIKRQDSNTSKLIYDIPFLIEFISNLITLNPGDIILTGTPDGVGVAMNPPQFLVDGDVVTLEIEKVGRMENQVVESESE